MNLRTPLRECVMQCSQDWGDLIAGPPECGQFREDFLAVQ
jgi:hypothetical protein